MRLLIDANILLDVLQKREPHYRGSSLIWKLCETGQDEGIVSAITIANLVYVLRKELDPEQSKKVMEMLQLIFRFADFTVSDMEKAADLEWDDYEDAIQSVTAERMSADYIITRNVRDFRRSTIPALTPSEFLVRMEFQPPH